MSQYVFDDDAPPELLARHTDGQQQFSRSLTAYAPTQPPTNQQLLQRMQRMQLGQVEAQTNTVKLIKDLLVLAGVFALFYWLILSKKSPLKNPGVGNPGGKQTKNTLARVGQNTNGSFYWQLLRKRGKRHGPYACRDDAVADAESNGYKVLCSTL